MKKWEYATRTTLSNLDVYSLNKLGNQGFELVSHTIDTQNCATHYYTFKKEIKE